MLKRYITVRNIILAASYLCLMTMFFTAGYSIGFKKGGGMITREVSAAAPSQEASTPAASTHTEQYRLILEGSTLRIYCDNGGISKLITDEDISKESFPTQDIALLEAGLVFDTKDKALAMMENFLS